ncbi:hypothetical protein OPT61_g5617 [Boeremia exigua]|uniref:Uncharacterized protein n=1 Tax=Boeremia exigua TaxID=749465 RepID=A0ACC2I9N6_9PLEO|nr:hypothetical protein OPT61_g5617 [Boeremia exigua]
MAQSPGHGSPPPEYTAEAAGAPQASVASHELAGARAEDLQVNEHTFDAAADGNSEPTPEPGVPQGAGIHVHKKRKGSGGGEMITGDRGDYLRWKDKNLELQGLLSEKEETVARLRLKHEENKVKQLNEQARLLNDLNKAHDANIKGTKKAKDEEIRLKKVINERDIQILDLEQQVLGLQQQLEHLKLSFTHAPDKQREPTLVPDPNRKFRENPEYRHPEAPREHKMYTNLKPALTYSPDAGKVRVTKYGSNKYWDLGLCRIRFEYGRSCDLYGCEFRHEPLTMNEQIYIRFLEPKGPDFIEKVAVANVKHRDRALL